MANLAMRSGLGVVTRHLCVVSRTPVMSGVFVAGLTTAVGSRDELEIIVDRRRGDPGPNHVAIERRQRDHVARALARDGFALVPVPGPEPSESSSPKRDRWPVESFAPEETYERKLERVLWYKQGRIVRLSRLLILSVLTNAILVGFFVSPAVKARWRQSRSPAAPAEVTTPAEAVLGETISPSPTAAPARGSHP